MEREDRDEQEIRGMFERARQADRSITPAFHGMVATDRSGAKRAFHPGRALSLGIAASLAVAAWLVLRAPSPDEATVERPIAQTFADRTVIEVPPPVPTAPPAVEKVEKGDAAHANLVAKLATKPSDERARELSAPGTFYQDVLTLPPGVSDDAVGSTELRGSRVGDFKAMAGEVAAVHPVSGLTANAINPDSIEEIAVVMAPPGSQHQLARRRYSIVGPVDTNEPGFNTESYAPIQANEFLSATENPLSTFAIDVDTASYANVRRFLKAGTLPPRDAVRVEELVNYFRYDDPPPTGDAPFSTHVDVATCPWNDTHRLARIGLKGREVARGGSKGSNLVFLIDVSGSMNEPAKLPLVQKSLGLLVNELDGRDQIAIVVYAGASGLVLAPSPGSAKAQIREALERLQAGGGTNGGAGIELAYKLAREHFIAGGINRVILATDGDFNLGITTQAELLALIENDARRGVFLTVLGFGMGNYKDSTLEMLADRGNGNYAYIDDLREARKVLVEEIGGTLVTIAKDVKIQVEFNPAEVAAYRLVGYENRLLRKEDFNDDRKDAGEIGAGHSVTALYEIVPAAAEQAALPSVDALKYQADAVTTEAARTGELFTLKLRYKEPEGAKSRLITLPVTDAGKGLGQASADFKFAAAVAEFGLLLRDDSRELGAGIDRIRALALEGASTDIGGYRAEFLDLLDRARRIGRSAKAEPSGE